MGGIREVLIQPTNYPAPGNYGKPASCFASSDADGYTRVSMPKSRRVLAQVKKDESLIPGPNKYQSSYMSSHYATSFLKSKKGSGNFSIPKAARHYDPRIYSMQNEK